nr:IS3 family transposase [Mesorhizobium sp. PAMC28654]
MALPLAGATNGASDAGEWPPGKTEAAVQAHDGQRTRLSGCPQCHRPGFAATGPNQKWGADISYIWTREGWLYLAVVIDLFARKVVGWAAGNRLHRSLALAALNKAFVMRQPEPGLIHHSDRGSQYCSIDYQAELRAAGVIISMSGKGNCFDNAMVETFFKTLKTELIWRTSFLTRADAQAAIARYIDGFYNPIRRHSALDYISPMQFERNAAE